MTERQDSTGDNYVPEWVQTPGDRPMVGSFRFWFTTGRWEWSPEVYAMHGYTPGEIEPTTELVLEHNHPDDRNHVAEAITRSIRQGEPFSSRHRFLDTTGGEHAVIVVADRIFDDNGRPVGTTGFYIDLSDRLAEVEQDMIDTTMPEIIEHREAIDQVKGVLMYVYRISAEQAFKVLQWRSQETNTKLRALAEQILVELGRAQPSPATVNEFDNILLTAHTRVPPPD
ncbi:PAS and ANTAR domain-containing protein [Nocardia sp. NPDC006044]|uniref:PAS and ANTAR domain-containing protein n=1 Tax=Nocardia sp. NPDC006044 TaxID=3364306 RepID=UPI0036A3CAA6